MKNLFRIVRERPLPAVITAAVVIGLLGAAVAAASVTGWPKELFSVASAEAETLPDNTAIEGWASAEGDSHFIGDKINYHLRVLYRPDQVTPDLDLLERSVSFLPFETLETHGNERDLGGGIQEYSLDFVLQAIDVEPSTSYPLETVVVYYDPIGVEGDEKRLRIQRAPLSVASYYPADVARIPLQPVKGQLGDQSPLRQSIMAVSGGAILLLALFLLWSHGRKRRSVELSEPEKLWQRKHDLSEQALGNREHLLGLEKIFTHLLEWRTQTAPGAFWAGADPVEPAEWTQASATARDLLSKVYQAEEPSAHDVASAETLLDHMLAPMIDEARLERENQPSAIQRLLRQPNVLAVSGISIAAAVVMFVLAAQPQLWLSPDLSRYNRAVQSAQVSEEPESADAAVGFSDVAEKVTSAPVQAAALYNSGTIRAGLPEAASSDFGEAELLFAVFQEDEPIQSYLDDQESIDTLIQAGVSLGQAVRDLQGAVRTSDADEDTRKNLELAGKRHRAVVASIQRLFEVGSPLPEAQKDALADVLNMKMPEEFKLEDKGKDNSNYLIMEKF